ncbi:hypothetical protein BJ944DRAFT_106274 [Cunninghamella echinulata]|nr:hypothetical protein BJ944DRAFT_106274 [Cunninghamella echinulata]
MAASGSSSSKIPEKWTSTRSLSEFLWQSPLLFQCKLNDSAKQYILRQCFEALWGYSSKSMQQYFFENEEDCQQCITQLISVSNEKVQYMSVDSSSLHGNGLVPQQDLSTQRGRQCGHVFRKGEPVYRCR